MFRERCRSAAGVELDTVMGQRVASPFDVGFVGKRHLAQANG